MRTVVSEVGTVRSADGTAIAFERTGSGRALVLVDAAAHYRAFSSFDGLVELLSDTFTVYQYDRRGRGESGDTAPYAPEREVEDLAALIREAGGSAFVHGFSSGCLVALHAAVGDCGVRGLTLVEPPIGSAADLAEQRAFNARLESFLAAGDRAAAVEHFLTSIGVPEDMVAGMRGTPSWTAMEAVAHTLAYDGILSEATSPELLGSVAVPTLVIGSQGSSDDLTGMAARVAAAIPNGTHLSLPGQWHGVADEILAPALRDFFLKAA